MNGEIFGNLLAIIVVVAVVAGVCCIIYMTWVGYRPTVIDPSYAGFNNIKAYELRKPKRKAKKSRRRR